MEPAPPFEVVEVAGGRVYRLPVRQLGALRLLAIGPLVLAGLVSVFFFNHCIPRFAKGPLSEWEWVLFSLFALGYARGFHALVSLAAAIWCGQTEVEVGDDGAMRALDRAGWFRVRWGRLKPGAARKLVLSAFAPAVDPNRPAKPVPSMLWQLHAERDRGRKVLLAMAYPREVLAALAARLAEHLVIAAPVGDDGVTAPTVGPLPVVVEEPEALTRDVLEQPATSRVVLDRHPDGVTLTVPPLGLRTALGGLIFAGLFFALIGGAVTVMMIGALVRGNARFNPGVPVGAVFLLFGVGMVLAAVQAGRKRAVLAVVGDRLLYFESGPLLSKRSEWTRDALRDIGHGPSNVSVNKKPLPQLQIVLSDGKNVGVLTGRDETELKWIATVLRHALRLPHAPPPVP